MEKSVGESNNSLERSKEDLKPKYYMEFDSEIAAFNFYNTYVHITYRHCIFFSSDAWCCFYSYFTEACNLLVLPNLVYDILH